MGRLLTRAFWLRWNVPGLGGLPMNAMLFFGAMLLGVAQPGLWLLALGCEVLFLSAMVFNPRFQKAVAAEDTAVRVRDEAAMRAELISKLALERKRRLTQLENRIMRLRSLRNQAMSDDLRDLLGDSGQALERVVWAFLKLLVAEEHLRQHVSDRDKGPIEREVAELRRALEAGQLSPRVAESSRATLRIMEERLANVTRRNERLAEIASQLTRIEAQVELEIENAVIKDGTPAASDFQIDLAFLDSQSFGELGYEVDEIDRAMQPPQPGASEGSTSRELEGER